MQPPATSRSGCQIQRDKLTWGSVHTARVAQQCLHANCPQMIWDSSMATQLNSPNLNVLETSYLGSNARRFCKLHPNSKTVLYWKSHWIRYGSVSHRSTWQSCPGLGNRWESTWRLLDSIMSIYFKFKKSSQCLRCLDCLIVVTNCDTSKTAKLLYKKHRYIVSSKVTAVKLSRLATKWTGN